MEQRLQKRWRALPRRRRMLFAAMALLGLSLIISAPTLFVLDPAVLSLVVDPELFLLFVTVTFAATRTKLVQAQPFIHAARSALRPRARR